MTNTLTIKNGETKTVITALYDDSSLHDQKLHDTIFFKGLFFSCNTTDAIRDFGGNEVPDTEGSVFWPRN